MVRFINSLDYWMVVYIFWFCLRDGVLCFEKNFCVICGIVGLERKIGSGGGDFGWMSFFVFGCRKVGGWGLVKCDWNWSKIYVRVF